MTTTITPPAEIWTLMYTDLFDFIQEWATSKAGSRPMMAAAMRMMPEDMRQDRVSDFINKKWSKMSESEPLINSPTTWEREADSFTNFKSHSAARFFVYKSFSNFCADEWKKMQREIPIDRKELTKMIDNTTTDNAVETLIAVVSQFTGEEAVIAMWRLGHIDRDVCCAKLGCSQATLFRKFDKMKTKYMGGAA